MSVCRGSGGFFGLTDTFGFKFEFLFTLDSVPIGHKHGLGRRSEDKHFY